MPAKDRHKPFTRHHKPPPAISVHSTMLHCAFFLNVCRLVLLIVVVYFLLRWIHENEEYGRSTLAYCMLDDFDSSVSDVGGCGAAAAANVACTIRVQV